MGIVDERSLACCYVSTVIDGADPSTFKYMYTMVFLHQICQPSDDVNSGQSQDGQ